ncbi:ATP-binding protein [Streptomyces sp. CG4]|uniref:ATP-binding protein n=1 Tax=Streptomyces sp. CG4 TaxID=408783 RepID=UPI0034E2CB3C
MAADEKIQIAWTEFPSTLSTAWACRRFVIDTLYRWGLLGLVADVQLVVGELVTNAVAASAPDGTDVTVCLRAEQGSLLIEVGDQVEALPVLHRPTLQGRRGLGLPLVASMSTRWGIRQEAGGKVVWSELACRKRPESAT